MGPAIFIIAILGCGEGDTACQQVATVDAHYSNVAECTAATPAAIEANADIAFPVVVAQCQRADGGSAEKVNPREIRLPEAQAPVRFQRASYETRQRS